MTRSTAAVLPSPAPSDEPSPILSNSNVHNSASYTENRQVTHVVQNPRPSGTTTQQPNEDGHHPASEADNLPEADKAAHTAQLEATFSTQPQVQAREQLTTSPEVLSSSPPRMLSGNVPSGHARAEQQRLPLAQDARSTTANGQPPNRARFHTAPRHQVSRPPPLSSTNISQRPRELLQGSGAGRDILEIGVGQLPSPSQTSASSPRAPFDLPLPSTMVQQAQSYPSPSSATPVASNPHKRQRTQAPVMPSLKPRIDLIQKQIASAGGLDCLNSSLERPRFQLLEDACRSEDSFYVALHQIFCIWDLPDPTQVTNIRDFPNSATLLLSFKIVGQLIRENEGLAPNHKKWFAAFPSPLPDLLRTSEPYRRTVRDVGVFLSRLATDWVQLSRDCAARSYPPLVDELVNRMGLLSPILQGVVFTAARRNLGVNDDPVGRRMEELFKKDRQDHQMLAARYNTARPPTDREVQERNQKLANDYVMLFNQHLISRRSSGSAVSSPATRLPTPGNPNTHFQPVSGAATNVIPVTQPDGNLGPRQTSSPNLGSNWQSANPPQSIRVGSTSSPNIAGLAIAVHSPNIVNTGTPSPTLLQGLTMQSPAQTQRGYNPVLRSNVNPVQQPNHQQNGPAFAPANTNGMVYQTPYQPNDPRAQQPQLSAQQIQQMQHMAAQQQQPYQFAAQQAQWQHQSAVQQQQQLQQQTMMQQQQQQHSQQQIQNVISMNRAAQIRRESSSGTVPQQRVHSRNNSISSNGRRTPGILASNVLSPRTAIAPAPSTRLDQSIRQAHPLDRPFVPPLEMIPVPQPVNPDVTALHQALLRSPLLVVPRMTPNSQNDPARRFYQVVRDFALGPTKLPMNHPLPKFAFTIPADDFARIARDRSMGSGKLPTRELKSGTLQYRLRCILTRPEVTICLPPDWIVSDTTWPENVFPMFNHDSLELRRKAQHGKDLPIDLTQHISATGANNKCWIQISVPKFNSKTMKDNGYFIAVEAIEVLHHKDIMETCLQHQRVAANITLDAIKKSLAPVADDDDDLVIEPSDLTIGLADPFTARIFDVPVRGKTCLHRECFDLETFLLTRNSKPKRPQQPCMPDVWKCPLCGKDARPYSLVVDEFMVSVRAELAKGDDLDVKAILISADGNWRPKPEPKPQRRDPFDDDFTSEDDEKPRKPSIAEMSRKRPVEVIDLDDD